VALIGTIGTCIANLHDYYIIHYLFRIERFKRAKQTKFYKKAAQWFNRAPFITLSTASFLPIPIDVVRILAVSTDYPRHLFTLANFTGRFPRYLLFAYLGYQMQLSNRAIFMVLIVTVVIGASNGLSKLYKKYKKNQR
jgi:membrane protein YqaA with SNARE-associated domain